MSKVTGIFEIFQDLDLIQTSDISKWLDNVPQPQSIENYIANRIIYPQAIPIKEDELKLDLALLSEVLKKKLSYYNLNSKKLIIPQNFIERFGGLEKLIVAFLNAYKPQDITQVVIDSEGKEETIGSTVVPKFSKVNAEFEFSVEEKLYKIKQGNLLFIPCSKKRCHIIFMSKDVILLNKNDSVLEAFGGSLGIVVDAR